MFCSIKKVLQVAVKLSWACDVSIPILIAGGIQKSRNVGKTAPKLGDAPSPEKIDLNSQYKNAWKKMQVNITKNRTEICRHMCTEAGSDPGAYRLVMSPLKGRRFPPIIRPKF